MALWRIMVITLNQAIQAFLLDQKAGLNSDKTVRWYTSLLTAFDDYLGEKLLTSVTADELRFYILHLKARLTDNSVIGHVTALRAFWTWAAREYDIANPSRNVKKPRKATPRPRAITPEDFGRMWTATYQDDPRAPESGHRDRCVLAFLGDTGVRLGGLVGIKIHDLLLDENAAVVCEKGQRSRKVFYSDFTAHFLRTWLDVRPEGEHQFLFTNVNHRSQPLGPDGVRLLLKRLAKRGDVQGKYNPHSFRHGLAREWLKNGGDAIRLSQQMGARVDTIATYYALFFSDERRDAQERHGAMTSYIQVLK